MSEIFDKSYIQDKVDVCVVGAGHAGCEAALACARLGLTMKDVGSHILLIVWWFYFSSPPPITW